MLLQSGQSLAWESGPRSAADLKEAAKHFERAAELYNGPAQKENCKQLAATLRSGAAAVEAVEADAKAMVRAEAEAKANAAPDTRLAEEVAEAAAAARASKGHGKGTGKAKAKAQSSGKRRGSPARRGLHV